MHWWIDHSKKVNWVHLDFTLTLRISWNTAHIWGVVYGWSCTVWWPELESGDGARDAHLCYSTSWNKNVKKDQYLILMWVLAYTFSVSRGLYHSSARATSGCSRSCRPKKKKVWIIEDYRWTGGIRNTPGYLWVNQRKTDRAKEIERSSFSKQHR